MTNILTKFFKNTKGSVLLMTGILFLAIMAILALSIDLGKVQSGYSKIQGSTDASALSLAEFVMKLKTDRIDDDDNWRDFVPDDETLRNYAMQVFQSNFELDQAGTEVEDYTDEMNFDVTYEKKGENIYVVVVESCAYTNPTSFTKMVGGEEQQKVCSSSQAEFSFQEVRNTETAFIIDKSAAYSAAQLIANGGAGVDTTRFPFVQKAINDILDKYYQDPEDNNYAAITGFMYPYYRNMSKNQNIGSFDDTYLHIRGYDHMGTSVRNGMFYGNSWNNPPTNHSGINPVTKEELHDELRMTFPIFRNAEELAAFDDRKPSEWPGGGLSNFWDRYMEVRDGYYNNDPILINYYTNINTNLGAFSGNLAYKNYQPLANLQLNSTSLCSYTPMVYGNVYYTTSSTGVPPPPHSMAFTCPQIYQPDGSKYPPGLGGKIQYVEEAWANWSASVTYVPLDDTSHPLNYVQVQPLTKNYNVLKDLVSRWTNIGEVYNQNISRDSRITNPAGQTRPAEIARLGGAGGSNWLHSFIHAWLLVSENYQGLWSDQSIHEKRLGANEDRSAIPRNTGQVTKHIIYIGSGIDYESMKTSCYNGYMAEMNGGPNIINSCFGDYYMPTEHMTDDQFISVCNKIHDSGVKIHIILQGFNPIGDTYGSSYETSIGQVAKKYSSASLVLPNGQPNDRRYRECASLRKGSKTDRSFYLNPASRDIPNILERIYQEEITNTAGVRLNK